MDQLKENLELAKKYLKLSGHMLYVTYPLVKDFKLFVGIVENIDKSLRLSMDSLLYYERMYKKISPYSDNFNVKLDIFRRVISIRYNIDPKTPDLIFEIKQIVKNRKEAPIEFARKDGFVICDADYKTRILKYEELKNYFLKAKVFILRVDNIINRGES